MILKTALHEKIVALKATSGVSSDEGMRLAYLAAHLPLNCVVVEIGSCWGRSASYLAAALQERDREGKLYCVDLWELGWNRTPPRHHSPGAYQQFEKNLKSLDLWGLIIPIKGESTFVASTWSLPIDLLFIDGGHKYEEVVSDYVNWSPFVKAGGIVAFHDYNHEEIRRCVDDYVIMSGLWTFIGLHERIWSAKRNA